MPPPANAPSVPVHKNLLPVTADSPVAIAADHELVTRTEFLPWSTPIGQPPQRHLPEHILIKMFLPPCDLHPATDYQQFSTFNPLTFRLTEAAWSRILSEYCDSGLLQLSFSSPRELRDALCHLTFSNPANLHITPDNITAAETYHATQPTDGNRGNGRGGRGGRGAAPQAAPTAPPPELLFLHLTPITHLRTPDCNEPLLPLSRLAGLLGPCHTRASRTDPTSPAALLADLITPNICSRLGAPNASPALIASNLPDFLLSTELPTIYQPARADPAACREELLDGIHYRLGSQQQRIIVERRRCLRLGAR